LQGYFDTLNQQYRLPQNDTEYANRVENIEKQLQYFQRTGTVAYVAGPPAHYTLTADGTDIVYRLGSVFYKEAELTQYAQRNEITQLLLSPLTQPTSNFPIYLYEKDKIFVYPSTLINVKEQPNITMSYIAKPVDIEWNFTVGGVGQYLYNSATSINFDLSVSEQTNVIIQVLAYAGVIINDPTIIQVAQMEQQQEQQTQNS